MSDWLNIEIDHSQYYRWVPVPEAEADVATTVPSTFPGMRMQRITVDEPTMSTCSVYLPDLVRWNDDRTAAGLSKRPHQLNLIQHLSDGPWPRQFPLDSITDIRADIPNWAAQLKAAFVVAPAATEAAQ